MAELFHTEGSTLKSCKSTRTTLACPDSEADLMASIEGSILTSFKSTRTTSACPDLAAAMMAGSFLEERKLWLWLGTLLSASKVESFSTESVQAESHRSSIKLMQILLYLMTDLHIQIVLGLCIFQNGYFP